MFEDHTPDLKQALTNKPEASPSGRREFWRTSGLSTALLIILVAVTASVLGFLGWRFLGRKTVPPPEQVVYDSPAATSTVVSTSTLPGGLPGNGSDKQENERFTNGTDRAENLAFAQFYEPTQDDFAPKPLILNLPMSAKTDLANFYDVSRKINLDKNLAELDRDGFAVIDNPLVSATGNFYDTFDQLIQKEIPQLLTGDYLLYYYQNRLKEAFKEVEGNVFYQELWQINKKFFDIASARYRKRRDKLGVVNDPIMEAERLEAGYFAVSLELLKPRDKQVNPSLTANDSKLFTSREATDFSFNPPDYLAEEVAREVSLILASRSSAKSPILLYEKNYTDFRVPDGYQKSAKLTNFYLATRWLNSVFPLYHKSDSCRNCLLDEDDWLISQIAATLVTEDFTENQELKNSWAKIYKLLSFFRGIRKELTYLHYDEVLKSFYGDTYQAEQIFSDRLAGDGDTARDQAMAAALRLETELIKNGFSFPAIEGGFSRSNPADRPQVGMRLLQEPYWPNDYIFNHLTGKAVGLWQEKFDQSMSAKYLPITGCAPTFSNQVERCAAIGMDIMNLLEPISPANAYFRSNSRYQNYQSRAADLSSALRNFNTDTWHANIFWTTLDLEDKAFFKPAAPSGPLPMTSQAWEAKNLNTALAGWVNLQLDVDNFGSGLDQATSLGGRNEINAYVEPNLSLVNEMMANTKMLVDMFTALKLSKDTDYTTKKLTELYDQLDKMKSIIKKELSGEVPDSNDQLAIGELIRQSYVIKAAPKTLTIRFSERRINQSLEGVKLLVAAYQLADKKLLVVGPVFNYRESK